MSRLLLQCLFVSLVYYVPVTWSRSYTSINEPTTRCSLDEIVNRLTLEDLARLVTRWGRREGLSPIRVLHRIENGISTSSHVHLPFIPDLTRTNTEAETKQDFYPMLPNRMPPPPSLTNVQPGLPPLGKLPPPPPAINIPPDFAQLPPFGAPVHEVSNQKFPSLIPFGTLRPPPDAIIQIVDHVFGTEVPAVSVTVTPQMTITEALLQAAIEYDTNNSPSDINYYKITWGRSSQLRCFVIRTVGNLSSTSGYIWEIILSDKTDKEIWRGICLPTSSEIHIRPGMTITLNYVKQEDL